MKNLIVGTVLVLICGSTSTGQEAAYGSAERARLLEEEWKDQYRAVDDLRPQIFKGLSAHDAEIANSIDFKVIGGKSQGDQFIPPVATMDDGQRTVIIGQGFLRLLSLFIEEEVYGLKYNKASEVDQHISLVLKQMNENITRQKAGRPLLFVESARTYFHWNAETLKTVTDASDSLFNVNLAFILAHEAGHHVLGHTLLDPKTLTKQQRFIQEEEADKWGANTLIRAGQIPIGAAMSLVLFERMFDAGIDDFHPSNDCREVALIQSSIDSLDEFRSQLEAKGKSVEAVRRDWQRQLAQLREMGNCKNDAQPLQSTAPKEDTVTVTFSAVLRGSNSNLDIANVAAAEFAVTSRGENLVSLANGDSEDVEVRPGRQPFEVVVTLTARQGFTGRVSCKGFMNIREAETAYKLIVRMDSWGNVGSCAVIPDRSQ